MSYVDFVNQFPAANLEDKIVLQGRSTDRSSPLVNHEDLGQDQAPKPLRVYYRKKLGKKNKLAGMEGSVNELSPRGGRRFMYLAFC
ncbi:hypothetical protein GH714_036470 [Hevea brasiliensis]|uniref:Uncharacterized protein n=1 Tax=Hevea brasiliensis TaxID=3981 RepID=A0A6A6KY77_HEVBR|nr:hypothetical protein GH714_036470 [Hevea brasiliensis]